MVNVGDEAGDEDDVTDDMLVYLQLKKTVEKRIKHLEGF